MALRKGINGKMKGHQWEDERASMGRRKGINGKGVPYQSPPNLPLPRADFSYTLMQMAGNGIQSGHSMI